MYDAASIQPIVQGLLIVSGALSNVPNTPTFQGRGVSAVTRVAGPPIAYVLTLDKGLPGNSGEVAAKGEIPLTAGGVPLTSPAGSGAPQLTHVPTPDARCAITIRGSLTNVAVAGGSNIVNTAVSYITPGADGGFTQVQLIFSTYSHAATAYVSVDPSDTVAAGAEIVIWLDPQRIN